jgi:DNA-directed RNA polymerase specialized sigma24 family protein
MSFDASDLNDLIAKARAGDNEAALRRAIHRRLRRRLHPLERVVGGSDICQETWIALLTGDQGITDQTFTSPAHLIAFLEGIARNKVREKERQYLGTQKRDLRRQVPLDRESA